MAQISGVPQAVVKGQALLLKILQGAGKDPPVILVHDLAAIRRHDIVEAAPLMHPQGQRSVLERISKGKLHLVAVGQAARTLLYALERIGLLDRRVQELPQLALLQAQLLLVGQALENAAAAGTKMRADRLCLHRRRLQHLQKQALAGALAQLFQPVTDFLAWQCVFHSDAAVFRLYDSTVGELRFLYDSLVNLSLFHKYTCFLSVSFGK